MGKKKKVRDKTVKIEQVETIPPIGIQKAQKVLVLAALFITPLMLYPLWTELSHAKFLSFQLVVSFLFSLFLIENIKESRIRIKSHPLNLPVFLFLIVCFASLYFAVNLLKGTDYLLKYAAYILFFFVISRLFTEVGDALKSFIVLYIACFITAFYGIYQFITLNLHDPEKAFYYYYESFFGNPNYAGQFLSVVIPLVIFIYWKSKGKPLIKASIIVSSIMILFYLVLTFARCAWMSLIFGLFVVFCTGIYLKLGKTQGKRGKRNFWIGLGALIFIMLLIFAILWVSGFSIYSLSFLMKRGIEIESTPYGFINSRLLLWRDSLDLIKANLPQGIGFGNYEFEIPEYQKFFPNSGKYHMAHGDYIQIACELGPIGVFVFLWFLISLFKALFLTIKRNSGERRILFISLLGSISTMCFFGLIDFPFYEPAPLLVFWLAAGIVASPISSKSQNGERTKRKFYEIKLPAFVIIALAMISIISFGKYIYHYARGGYLFEKGYIARDAKSAIDFYSESLNLWDHEFQTHFKLGEVYYFTGNHTKAESELNAALKLHPYHWQSIGNIGLMYMNQFERRKSDPERGRYLKTAYEYIKKSNDINYQFNLYNLGVVLYYKGEYSEAVDCFKREIEIFPKNIDAYFWAGRCLALLKKPGESEIYFKKAVELAPDNFKYLFGLSESLYSDGKYEESYDTISKALEISPDNNMALGMRKKLVEILMKAR